MNKENDYNILSGTLILSLGVLISRIIGFAYRIPIQQILGDEGNGLYGEAYQIYTVILTITAIAMPGALSKIIAQSEAANTYTNSDRILRVSIKYSCILASILGLLVFFMSDTISEIAFPNDNIGEPLKIFALTAIIATIIANLRGYFQGLGNMRPTALSQIIEQILNVFVSVLLAYQLSKKSILLGVVGSCIGTTIGALAALIILVVYFKRTRYQRRSSLYGNCSQKKDIDILGELLKILVPVVISTSVFSIMTFIDYSMVSKFLPQSIETLRETRHMHLIPIENPMSLDTTTIVQKLKGLYSFQYNTFINIPISLILQLALVAIPSLSIDFIQNNRKSINAKVQTVMKIGLLFAIPASIAFLVFGVNIIQLVLGNNASGGELLSIGGISLIPIACAQLTASILQALGKAKISSLNSIFACSIKIIFNFILISIPELNIYSVIISTFICYTIYAILNIFYLYKEFTIEIKWMEILIKPFVCSIFMAVTSYIFFIMLNGVLISSRLCMLITIFFCIISYYMMAKKLNIMLPEIDHFISNCISKHLKRTIQK